MPDYTYPFNELDQSRVEDVGGKIYEGILEWEEEKIDTE